MKALIVDDEMENLVVLSAVLKKRGHEVLQARNGLAAWNLLQTEQIPLVLTDWMMPEMEGPHLIQNIRQANFPYYTYIMLMTARNTRQDLLSGLQSGSDDFLTKPFDFEELQARLSIAERILDLEIRLRQALEKMSYMATYDAMTGLLNRRAMYERSAEELIRSQRQRLPFSLVMIDIDHFKAVNDHYGHHTGDLGLRFVADKINNSKRPYDHAGRWGGEEFLLCLPGAALEDALQIAERLRAQIAAEPLKLEDGRDVSLHASFGVAGLTGNEVPAGSNLPPPHFETLVQFADMALYQAKNEGRNRVCQYRAGLEKALGN